jgi:hypothetical protein
MSNDKIQMSKSVFDNSKIRLKTSLIPGKLEFGIWNLEIYTISS